MFPRAIPDRTISVHVTPRPMRSAIILDADGLTAIEDFAEVHRFFFRLWGGLHNVIVPSKAGDIDAGWFRVLDLVDPDCIYSVPKLTEETISRINRDLAPAVFRHALEQYGRRDGRLHAYSLIREQPAGITTIPQAIAAQRTALYSPQLVYVTGTGAGDPSSSFIEHNFGTLSDDMATRDAFRDLEHRAFKIHEDNAQEFLGVLTEHANNTITPDRLSLFNACPPVDDRGGKYEHRFTIVVGDLIDDRALARAIRMSESWQVGRRSIWLPLALGGNSDMIAFLQRFIIKSFWSGGNTRACQFLSLSVERGVLEALAEAFNSNWQIDASVMNIDRKTLGFPESRDSFIPAVLRGDRLAFYGINLTMVRQCSLNEGAGTLHIELPAFLRGGMSDTHVALDLEIPFLRNDRSNLIHMSEPHECWRLPRRQGLAAALVRSNDRTRITRAGLPSAMLTLGTDRLPLRIPSPYELHQHWASNDYVSEYDVVGRRNPRFVRWEVSDEGLRLNALVRLFGSPYACGHTLAEPFWGSALREISLVGKIASDVSEASVRRGLALLHEHESGVRLDEADGMAKGAAFLARHIRASVKQPGGFSRSELQELFNRIRQGASGNESFWANTKWKDVHGELDRYVEADILRMGVRIRCGQCLYKQWVSVNNFAATVECRGCGEKIRVGAEPEWSYQVNTLAAEAFRSRGIIAVVKALYDAEMRAHFGMFVALPSLNVFAENSRDRFTDIDLIYFAGREFVIGEVKSDPTGFSEEDLNLLRDVAADLCPNRVVLAAPGQDWPEGIEQQFQRCKQEQAPIGVKWEIRKL